LKKSIRFVAIGKELNEVTERGCPTHTYQAVTITEEPIGFSQSFGHKKVLDRLKKCAELRSTLSKVGFSPLL
jgi:hypothetical protein